MDFASNPIKFQIEKQNKVLVPVEINPIKFQIEKQNKDLVRVGINKWKTPPA